MTEVRAADNKSHTANTSTLQSITCYACKKIYTSPKTINCLHSFCISCLRSFSSVDSKNCTIVECPTCSVQSPVPDNDFEAYPDAFHIKRKIQMHEFMQKVKGRTPALCQKCSTKSEKATSYCSHCAQFICDLCVTIHRCWTEFKSHKVVPIADLRQSTGDSIPDRIEPLLCSLHSKNCTMFCETCQIEICHECIIRTHRDHKYNLVDESATEHKESLKQTLCAIEDIPEQLQLAIDQIRGISERFAANTKEVVDEAKVKFEGLQKQLSERCDELLKGAHEFTEERQKPLHSQLDELTAMKTKASDCIEFVTETTSSSAHITEFFSVEKQMIAQVKAIEKEFKALDLLPIEEPEIHLSMKPTMVEMIKVAGNVYDGSVLYAGSSEGKYFAVNEIITFFIALSSAFYKSRASPIDKFKADIQSLRDGSVCPAKIAVSSSGFAKLQCSFTERGRYCVNVYSNGRHITGSPHAFYVIPSSKQFQAPLKTIANLNSPRGIAINPKNQIVITEENQHSVMVYGRKSKKILTFGNFGTGDSQLNQPLGVAVDREGNMYVADSKNNCLKKYSADGAYVAMYKGEKSSSGSLSKPSSVKVNSKGLVHIVDRGNARIVVLNKNLEFQFQFGSPGVGLGKLDDPWDVAFDAHGICYITDIKQDCIHLFSQGGEFRGRIGSHGTQKGKLSRPSGIAIDRFSRIFVTEAGNHRVSIFHVCSEFLECFSTGLTMVNPCGIAVDEDGFVYVTCSTYVHVF